VIEELDSDISSDGSADAVLERDMRYYAGYSSVSSSSAGLPLDMQDLCTLAGRLVSSLFCVAAVCACCVVARLLLGCVEGHTADCAGLGGSSVSGSCRNAGAAAAARRG
jgi:hypothetical protein